MKNDTLLVHGGNPLKGEVQVRGAKNLVPKAMVAALLSAEPSELANVPRISDVGVTSDILALHGVRVAEGWQERSLRIEPRDVVGTDAVTLSRYGGTSRIPVLLCGPLLHRLGRAVVPVLGGCRIGDRPVGYHLDALAQMGAQVETSEAGLELTAPKGLKGTRIRLPYPSVGATEQVLLAAVLADGETVLENAAIEPEVIDLLAVLQKMGADVVVGTDRTINIRGVASLSGYRHTALPDRLETASWACAALATGGDVYVRGARQLEMMTFLNTYRRVGGKVEIDAEGIRFSHPGTPLKAMALETDVHPGLSTDYQQPLVVALTQAEGMSILHETVYENRFGFTSALNEMGAKVQLYSECVGPTPCRFGTRGYLHSAAISGPTPLHAAEVTIPDLRGGFSHLVAALAAEGTSTLHGTAVIERGYEELEEKVEALGGKIEAR